MVCYGKVRRGFEYPILKFAVITESDIFGAQQKKKKRHAHMRARKYRALPICRWGIMWCMKTTD